MVSLDRIPEFDTRSRNYPIRALLDTTQPRSYTWGLNLTLNQNTGCYHCYHTGGCVGHAWAHEAAARPKVHPIDTHLPWDVYHAAQRIDSWPGESYEGTSVLAGAKIMQQRGLLTEYRWAFSLRDALAGVSRHGPGVAGLNWYEGMMEPDDKGFVHPTGRLVGGHAILVRGVNVKRKTVTLRNSWSAAWGRGGDCYLTWDDFGRLLDEDGELCLPVVR